MPKQGNKYNILHIFSEMIRANKNVFIFCQGSCTMNVLHLSLSKSLDLSICGKNPMKNSTLGYFCKSTYSQMHRKLQPWWFFGRLLLCSVLQIWNFSSPHDVTYFVCQSLQKYMEKVTSKVPFPEVSWENIHFCGLKKRLISNGRKIKKKIG